MADFGSGCRNPLTPEQWDALRLARETFQKQLATAGIDEEAYLADFAEWRKQQQKQAEGPDL